MIWFGVESKDRLSVQGLSPVWHFGRLHYLVNVRYYCLPTRLVMDFFWMCDTALLSVQVLCMEHPKWPWPPIYQAASSIQHCIFWPAKSINFLHMYFDNYENNRSPTLTSSFGEIDIFSPIADFSLKVGTLWNWSEAEEGGFCANLH